MHIQAVNVMAQLYWRSRIYEGQFMQDIVRPVRSCQRKFEHQGGLRHGACSVFIMMSACNGALP